jgi:hypothetical protein
LPCPKICPNAAAFTGPKEGVKAAVSCADKFAKKYL